MVSIDNQKIVEKCIQKATAGLVNCNVRIIPQHDLTGGDLLPDEIKKGLNSNEREAASYYASRGYKIIRLSFWSTGAVGDKKIADMRFKGLSKATANLLRDTRLQEKQINEWMPDGFLKQFRRISKSCKYPSFDKLYKGGYSMRFYPPDLIVVNLETGDWRFVEVKGPTDSLSLIQAYWYIFNLDKKWNYELFVITRHKINGHYFEAHGERMGDGFSSAVSKALNVIKDEKQWYKDTRYDLDAWGVSFIYYHQISVKGEQFKDDHPTISISNDFCNSTTARAAELGQVWLIYRKSNKYYLACVFRVSSLSKKGKEVILKGIREKSEYYSPPILIDDKRWLDKIKSENKNFSKNFIEMLDKDMKYLQCIRDKSDIPQLI